MPIYEFQCERCGARFEELVSSGSVRVPCAECGSAKTRRAFPSAISPPGRLPRGASVRDSESRRRRARSGAIGAPRRDPQAARGRRSSPAALEGEEAMSAGAGAPQRREELVELFNEASGCLRCPLSETRTKVVFGAGNADADLMFVGEAPGAEEDRRGLPFVGRAGGLLNEMLAGIGMSRDDVFIANVLKCRPPGNRDPQPVEIESCRPYLLEQVRLIEPRVVATLGNFATKLLSGNPTGITKVRGTPQVHELGRPDGVPAAALPSCSRASHAGRRRDAARRLPGDPRPPGRAAAGPRRGGAAGGADREPRDRGAAARPSPTSSGSSVEPPRR